MQVEIVQFIDETDTRETESRMKIVFVNRYFYPDQSATSRMVSNLAFALKRAGFEVTAIASRSLHNDQDTVLPAAEIIDGVDIRRFGSTNFGRKHSLGRAIDYLTFHLSAFFWYLQHLTRNDVCVVCTDPPLLSVTSALPIRLKGARMINWIMDLFPEAAIELDMLSAHGVSGRLSLAMRDNSIRHSALIACPTESMARYLRERALPADAIRTIHLWSDCDEIRPVAPQENRLRRQWGLENVFVIGYSGNFGRAHDFTTLLEAAARLRHRDDIRFLLIGGGQQRPAVEEAVHSRGLVNVIFKPLQPAENIAESLSVADAHIVSLLPNLEHCIMPSKFYGVMAAGRPTLFVGDDQGEVAHVIRRSNCGATVAIGDGHMLADTILAWRTSPEHCREMGRRARRFAETEFSSDRAVRHWCEIFRQNETSTDGTPKRYSFGGTP